MKFKPFKKLGFCDGRYPKRLNTEASNHKTCIQQALDLISKSLFYKKNFNKSAFQVDDLFVNKAQLLQKQKKNCLVWLVHYNQSSYSNSI